MMPILFAVLMSVLALAAWIAGLVGLPGNWLIVILAGLSWALADPASGPYVATTACLSLIALAGLGELLEFIAGALGVQRAGGSRRSASYALGGSIAGAILGLVVGTGIPIIGNLIASVLGSALGALVGAIYSERTSGQPWQPAMQVGTAAFIGRIAGTFGKALCGGVMLIIFLWAIWI